MLMRTKKVLDQNLNRQMGKQEMSAAQAAYLLQCRKEKRLIRFWQWIIMVLF